MTTPPLSALARQEYRLVDFDDVRLHPQNMRRGDVPHIVESIRLKGFYGACGQQRSSGFLIWGNHRFLAAQEARRLMADAASGAWDAHNAEEATLIESWQEWPARFGALDALPIFDIDCDDDVALNILLDDNASSDRATWRPELAAALREIETRRGSLDGTGFTRAEVEQLERDGSALGGGFAREQPNRLADRFLVPPFSVLDARQGYWQDRKREWLSLGIRSDLGRKANLEQSGGDAAYVGGEGLAIKNLSGYVPDYYQQKRRAEARLGRELSLAEFEADYIVVADGSGLSNSGISTFDPVLTELAYRWWSPEGARVLDPFAGGSVRGIVASRLGRPYVGVDLRAEQLEANEEQASAICRAGDPRPEWLAGDAMLLDRVLGKQEPFDFVFSCPPYFDLEQYGDDPADLSNAADWPAFCSALDAIVGVACDRLRPGRFACFVVGNVRAHDEGGRVRDLSAATVHAFEEAGLVLYNDAILVTALGSLAIRAARIFQTRKLGRTHQQVLVFLKPPLAAALAACGPIEVADPAEAFGRPLAP